MRTQSIPEECYFDRNLLIQLLAVEYMRNKKTAFITKDSDTPGFSVICIDLDGRQVSWHIPDNEVIIHLPMHDSGWLPIDVEDRKTIIEKFIKQLLLPSQSHGT